VIVGFAWLGAAGRPEHVLIAGGKAWGWIAAEPFFLRGLRLDLSPAALGGLLQLFSVGLAGLIPLSSGADRWRLGGPRGSPAPPLPWPLLPVLPPGMGRRMAGATRRQLRTRPGLPRRRWLGRDSSDGWTDRTIDHLDSPPPAGKVFRRGAARRTSRAQRGAGSAGLPVRVDRMVGFELWRRDSVLGRGAGARCIDRRQYYIVRGGFRVDDGGGDARPVWTARRVAERQWVGGGLGGEQCSGRVHETSSRDYCGWGCGHRGSVGCRFAGIPTCD